MADYRPKIARDCPRGLTTVIQACTHRDPAARMTSTELVTALNGCIAELRRPSST